MKKEKKHRLRFCNRILSGGLALLGFSACDRFAAVEYGMPYCHFEIKGKVQNELQQPVSGARILVKELLDNGEQLNLYHSDTVYTERNGDYQFLDKYAVPDRRKYRIVCEDVTGEHKSDSTEIQMEPTGPHDGWFEGEDSKEVNFNLKKKDE
ncbi:radical SAM-associated putative lipoprotein [Bacteroides sp. UBA939]|uniref:radical SAM-associated putative lipoprotein n=1 Tax=Bacteroides sp. UBA939 TaxID=1946092 RepID=UPI0025BB852A|nr:radical SAM-associated putative lipoprotein [Bacteroides sp. UBA939]